MHAPTRYRLAVTEAKDDEAAPEDEARRRFREALERKNAKPGSHPGSQAAAGNQLKGSNGKRKREFRRKSG
jgi:hypothetical protein